MFKKSKTIMLLFILIISVFTSVSTAISDDCYDGTLKIFSSESKVSFNEINIVSDDFLEFQLDTASSYLSEEGKVSLPVVSESFVFPFGTEIVDVICETSDVSSITIDTKIKPSPVSVAKNKAEITSHTYVATNDDSSDSSEIYPSNWFSYRVKSGLFEGVRSTIVIVDFYPVRYSSKENMVLSVSSVDVNIRYRTSSDVSVTDDDYDMVIITPKSFKRAVNQLVSHKNEVGVKTLVKTTESIYLDSLMGVYDDKGRDRAEQIKYFIKYAIENYGISYVLLVGGLKGQSLSWYPTINKGIKDATWFWYVPVRYSNNDDGWDAGYLTDLYYSDIYNGESGFSSWDSDNDGIFAEFPDDNDIDYMPDVFVGRLPCRNKRQVANIVEKIISYEKNTYSQSWFDNMCIFGGDTSPPDGYGTLPGYYEGEIITNVSAVYMNDIGFDITRMWASNGNLTCADDVINCFAQGAGFMHFSGHSNPITWSTHCADENTWLLDFLNLDMNFLENNGKYPIVVVGGCHNSQFDVTMFNIIKDMILYGPLKYFSRHPAGKFYHMEWIPDCWSWHLLNRKDAGSIATIGNTGLGYEYINDYCTEGLSGWMESRFFHAYAVQGKVYLGDVFTQGVSDYITLIGGENTIWDDRKTIEEWTLFGDPSLMIGGYPS